MYRHGRNNNNGNKNSIYLAGESAGGNLIISIIPNLSIKIKGIINTNFICLC